MDVISELFWYHGRFLGVEWHPWKVVGWLGNGVFFSRFLVQWYVTEKKKQVVVPVIFWWLSLIGALMLFSYALCYQKDSVFIFAYAFTWIPYIRNLVIHKRHLQSLPVCSHCGSTGPSQAKFCPACGRSLESLEGASG